MPNPQKSFSESGTSLAADGGFLGFAGDWRAMLAIAKALEASEEVEVYLEHWQVLAWRRL